MNKGKPKIAAETYEILMGMRRNRKEAASNSPLWDVASISVNVGSNTPTSGDSKKPSAILMSPNVGGQRPAKPFVAETS